jgi:hypothetical protein
VRQGIYSSTIAVGAAILMFVSAASAHPHAPAIASRANNPLAHSLSDLRLGASWLLLPAKLGPPAAFDGDGASADALSPSACLDGKFPWIPVGTFDGFDAFKYKLFDPQSGQYGVYADSDAPTLTGLRPRELGFQVLGLSRGGVSGL